MKRRRRGYNFIELMLCMALLAVFAVVLARMLHVERRLIHHLAVSQRAVTQVDSMLGRLRQDVWRARDIAVSDGGRLTLRLPDGATIVWSHETLPPGPDAPPDLPPARHRGVTTRQGGDTPALRWAIDEVQPRFHDTPGGIRVTLTQPTLGQADAWDLASPVRLLADREGATP